MTVQEPQLTSRKVARDPRIDRDSFEPPYHQLAAILRRQISAGGCAPATACLQRPSCASDTK